VQIQFPPAIKQKRPLWGVFRFRVDAFIEDLDNLLSKHLISDITHRWPMPSSPSSKGKYEKDQMVWVQIPN